MESFEVYKGSESFLPMRPFLLRDWRICFIHKDGGNKEQLESGSRRESGEKGSDRLLQICLYGTLNGEIFSIAIKRASK